MDKSFKNNGLKDVTKLFHGAGMGSLSRQMMTEPLPGVAGSCDT